MLQLCSMITNLYTRITPINAIVADSAQTIFSLLLNRQSAIADIDYNRRKAPHLADELTPALVDITSGENDVQIQINYPSTIRFLDLKKSKSGKKKKVYTPIYNRLLFGHVYGSGYSLSNVINVAMHKEFDNYFNNLRNVMQTIQL